MSTVSSDAIVVDGLTVAFRGVVAVSNASFRAPEGASFGLVGESGSGKSTILRAIAGLVPDWTGRMEVEGRALGRKRDARFLRTVQMVFQDPYGSLHPRHTVDVPSLNRWSCAGSAGSRSGSSKRSTRSVSAPRSVSAILTSSRVGNANGWPSPAR